MVPANIIHASLKLTTKRPSRIQYRLIIFYAKYGSVILLITTLTTRGEIGQRNHKLLGKSFLISFNQINAMDQ
jgi:hypothetical protein